MKKLNETTFVKHSGLHPQLPRPLTQGRETRWYTKLGMVEPILNLMSMKLSRPVNAPDVGLSEPIQKVTS